MPLSRRTTGYATGVVGVGGPCQGAGKIGSKRPFLARRECGYLRARSLAAGATAQGCAGN